MGFSGHFLPWLRRIFPKKTLGRRGEDEAARFLKRLGYQILARGRRLASGELDLVALDGRTLVFVEVYNPFTPPSARLGFPTQVLPVSRRSNRNPRWHASGGFLF